MTMYELLQAMAVLLGPMYAGLQPGPPVWMRVVAATFSLPCAIAAALVLWRLGQRVPQTEFALGLFYIVAFAAVAAAGLLTARATMAVLALA